LKANDDDIYQTGLWRSFYDQTNSISTKSKSYIF